MSPNGYTIIVLKPSPSRLCSRNHFSYTAFRSCAILTSESEICEPRFLGWISLLWTFSMYNMAYMQYWITG